MNNLHEFKFRLQPKHLKTYSKLLPLFLLLAIPTTFFIIKNTSRATAQDDKAVKGEHPAPTTQIIYAPTTGLPGAGQAELVLNNNSPNDMVVTPTLYSKNGRPIVGNQLTLKPAEVRHVPVARLAHGAVEGEGSAGGISLSYFGGMLELGAQITLFGQGRSGSVDIPFSAAGDYKSVVQEAVWWSPDGATVTLVLGNASDTSILVKLVFGSGEEHKILVSPFATETVTHKGRNPTSAGAADKSRNSISDGAAESVRLELSGAVGSLRAAGHVRSANKDFTSTIRFYDPQKVRQPNLYATNLKLENSTPHLVLKNISNEPITATPKFLPLAGSAGGPLELPQVSLAAREAKEVDLAPLIATATGRDDFEMVSVEVTNSGPTGSLIGALCSRDRTSLITYDVPLRDSGPARTSTGSYPWRVDEDYSTIVTITNISQKLALFTMLISYPGGQYILDPQRVEAGATAMFDLNKIQREQIPDRDGQTIPLSVTGGQFRWSVFHGRNEVKLIGRARIVSRANRVSMSYSCELCCPDRVYLTSLSPTSVSLVVGEGTAGIQAQETDIDCFGNFVPSVFVSADWDSDDAAIASVSPTNGQSTTVTGVGGGTTQVSAFWVAENWFFNNSIDDCSMDPVPVLLFANVQVCEVSISDTQSVMDGGSANFSVTLNNCTATGYEWSFAAPNGAGNNPYVAFSSSSASTSTDAHWYAYPYSVCPAAPCESTYQIMCRVTLSNGSIVDKFTALTVNGCWFPAGQVDPNEARVTGVPARAPDANGIWRITGMGTLGRQIPQKRIFVPYTSQFYTKADAHEQEHSNHWSPGNLFGGVHQPADFFARIQNFTGNSQQDLLNKVIAEFQIYTAQQDAFVSANQNTSERLAYQVSDPIDPQYLYQNCGRY